MSDQSYIELWKQLITSQYNLKGDMLSERDFEYLNKTIYSKTRTDISTATLRRIWSGKYQKVPQTKTLDALARFLDFEGWHDFRLNHSIPESKGSGKRKLVLVAGVLLAISIVSVLIAGSNLVRPKAMLRPEVSHHEGVPATIGFQYEIEDEGIEIELSWNPYERVELGPSGNFYSGTYYYPDYHHAKLLYNNEVLTSRKVHITTRGWHGLIMKSGYDANPVYLDNADFLKNDKLAVTGETIKKYNLTSEKERFPVFTLSSERLEKVSGDDFSLMTAIKSTGDSVNPVCRQTDLVIKGEYGAIRIPVSQTGCYGITTLKCGTKQLSGKRNDLSDLSADLRISQVISLENNNQVLKVRVGNNAEFVVNHEESFGPLKVIKFIFMGEGEVSDFELRDGEKALIESGVTSPF